MLRKIVISVVIVGVSVGNLAQGEAVQCFSCTDCAELKDRDSTVNCDESTCAVWKNSDGKIERGCKPDGVQADDLKHECSDGLCNDKTVLVCQKCSANVDDCEDVFCKIEDEGDPKCYISTADESRGCKSDLQTENGYEFCSTSNCNRVAICIECNSDDDVDCQQGNLDQKNGIKCPNKGVIYEKGCYREEGDDVSLQLGCTSNLEDPAKEETQKFKTCAADSCNKKAILSCYQCEDCGSINAETKNEPCNNYPTSCYTARELETKKISRGCSDAKEGFDFYELCDEEASCNNKDFPYHRKCYQCTENCESLDDTKLDYCPDMEADFCYTLQGENGLIHGCDKDDRAEECNEIKTCRKCEDDACNIANPDPIQCFECEGADQCKDPGTGHENCPFNEDKCIMSWEDGQLTKGCSTPELASSCGTDNCKLCSESLCNEQHCVQCNFETDADCITGKGNVGYELCKDAEDKCVAFVNDDGFTVRGCKSSFPDLTCGTDCEFDGPGSNDDLFPKDALQCLHCIELACDLESSTAKYCRSNQNLGCFIKFNGQAVSHRGCVTTEMQCDKEQDCYICTGENCNKEEQRFECNSCSASNADDDCVGDPEKSCKSLTGCVAFISADNNIVRDCVENVQNCPDGTCSPQPTNGQDVCFDIVDGKSSLKVCKSKLEKNKCWRYQKQGQVRMGCNEDKDEICGNEDFNCKACNSNLCNEKEVAECYCTDCGETTSKLCDDPEDRCYTRVEEGQVSKGCSKDMQPEAEDKFCDGPLCNNGWICHSCSTADGEDCLGDKSKSCITTSGCVTLLEGNNVVRGCAEDVCNADQEGCENTCTTEYCNNQDVCYACDDCVTVAASKLEICSTQVDTNKGCYSRQDVDSKIISRGCVDEQSNEKCQEGFNCILCKGTKCNDHEPMQHPLKCSICDLGMCTDYAPANDCDSIGLLDQCVEYAPFNLTLYKGCLSSTPQKIKNECMGSSHFCTFCNNDYCNTEALSCYQCSTKESSLECLLNPEKYSLCSRGDICTTCLDTEGHLHRGCSSGLTETCSGESGKCTFPDCNKEPFPTGRLECHQCQDCLETPESNIKPCLLYKDIDSCYIQVVDESTVHRGCTSDNPETNCENCLECSDQNGCNSMGPMQNNTLSCVSCTSNADCEGRAFGSLCQAQILIGRTDSCYTQMFEEFVIAKGCLSDLPTSNPSYDDCMQSSSNCPTCSTPDCNKGKTSCFKCNSADDADCSELASLTNYRTECEAECVTILDDKGYTVRGCIEHFAEFDKEDCTSSDRCQVCADKNCNDAMLPENMVRRCYHCEGSNTACLEATMPSTMKACRKYVPEDKCYVRAENATWITRGCLSDLTEEASCDEFCLDCNDDDGCNSQPVLKQNSLVCISCKGADCQGQKEGKRCTEKILLGREDSCYQYDDGQTVQKGCMSDLMLDEESEVKKSCETGDEETCKLCNYDACNGEYYYCVSCDSSKDPECAGRIGTVSEALRKDCDVSRCVSKYKDNTTVIKGCASATEPCEKNDPYCSECEGNLCNNIPFPADRILCHQCSGCDDVTAVEATICPNYNPEESCFTRMIDGAIHRGCLSEATVECDEQCFTCNSNGCNNEPSQYDSELSCVHCQGGTQCKEATVDQSKKCQGSVALGETDECYTLKVGGEVLERGCVVSKQTSCNGLNCEETTCSCNNCNLADKELTCHKCEGKDCGNAISAPGETCKGIACVSYVSRDGIVSRGCLQDYQTMCSIYGNRNSLCFGDQCNGEIYPVGRMTCYQCEGCASPEQSRICERYVENDGCYTLTDGIYVERGCLSDLPLGCSGSECVACSDPNCNDKEMTTDAPPPVTTTEAGTTSGSGTTPGSETTPEAGTTPGSGNTPGSGTSTSTSTTTLEPVTQSCIICSETASNEMCAWAFKPSLASTCPVSVNETDDVGCFGCLKDSRVIRGCTTNLREDTCDTVPTINCSESGCNTASFRVQRCAICTTDCDGSKASYPVQNCTGDVEYEQRGCYVRRSVRLVVTERGCFADLSEEQQQDCLKNGDACLRCTGDGCNGGTRMEAFWAMIIGALAFVIMRVKFV